MFGGDYAAEVTVTASIEQVSSTGSWMDTVATADPQTFVPSIDFTTPTFDFSSKNAALTANQFYIIVFTVTDGGAVDVKLAPSDTTWVNDVTTSLSAPGGQMVRFSTVGHCVMRAQRIIARLPIGSRWPSGTCISTHAKFRILVLGIVVTNMCSHHTV